MADPTTLSLFRGIIPSADELVDMTEWPDKLIEDYLSLTNNLAVLAERLDEQIDQKIEEVPTDFTDGSIPFADSGFLIEDNPGLVWDVTDGALEIVGKIDIEMVDPTDIGLTITTAENQTAFPIQLYDYDLNDVMHVWHTGHISNIDGINSEAAEYGTGILLHNFGESVPEHTNGIGSYDHTGGVQEQLFTKTSGDDFTQSDADEGKFIILFGVNLGATAEIKVFIDADNVIVDGSGWDQDLVSQSFGLYKHPVFFVGDGDEAEFSTGATGKFEIFGYGTTSSPLFEIEMPAAADTLEALILKVEANGYNTIIGQDLTYESGDLQPADVGALQLFQIDDTDASSADSTTQIAGSVYTTVNASNATKDAIVVLPGFTNALEVQGAPAEDPGYGYETTLGVSIDRVNSGGGGDDAFVNPAVDVVLYDNNGDDALWGSDNKFELLDVILSIGSSKNLLFTWWYSKAGGNWTLFVPQSDNTDGFQNSGLVAWLEADLTGWTKDNEDLDGNAITDAYYIAATRTRGGTVTVLPTESYFKTFASQATGALIDGQGYIKLRSSSDADAPNDTIYNSTDAGVTVHKDSGGVVHDFY